MIIYSKALFIKENIEEWWDGLHLADPTTLAINATISGSALTWQLSCIFSELKPFEGVQHSLHLLISVYALVVGFHDVVLGFRMQGKFCLNWFFGARIVVQLTVSMAPLSQFATNEEICNIIKTLLIEIFCWWITRNTFVSTHSRFLQ